jgi:MtN3 and saliva related transmembrane protein
MAIDRGINMASTPPGIPGDKFLMMNWTDILGLSAGICVTIAVLPQIWKAWKTKKVKDISPIMFGILVFGVALWVVYGVVENDLPIIATNSASLLLNGIMLYLMVRYNKN